MDRQLVSTLRWIHAGRGARPRGIAREYRSVRKVPQQVTWRIAFVSSALSSSALIAWTEHEQLNLATLRFKPHLFHHRQGAVGSGADHQPPTFRISSSANTGVCPYCSRNFLECSGGSTSTSRHAPMASWTFAITAKDRTPEALSRQGACAGLRTSRLANPSCSGEPPHLREDRKCRAAFRPIRRGFCSVQRRAAAKRVLPWLAAEIRMPVVH